MSSCSSQPVNPSSDAFKNIVDSAALIKVAFKLPTPGTSRESTKLPVVEHGASLIVGGIHKVHSDFSGGKGNAVQLKISGFLNLTVGDRNPIDDGFANVCLPNSNLNKAIFWNALRWQQSLG